MGYACPVCGTPQRDGEHLANHLAFTAMLHGDDHEDWLDEHAPGWGTERPADLAARVIEHAEEAAYDEVFEDTTGDATDRGHDHGHGDHARGHDRPNDVDRGPAASGFESAAQGVADEAIDSVLREARDLTAEMYGVDEEAEEASDEGADEERAGEEQVDGSDGERDERRSEESEGGTRGEDIEVEASDEGCDPATEERDREGNDS